MEAIAERDQLRAQHAVDIHRQEQRLVQIQDSAAGYRADLGRREAKIFELEGRRQDDTDFIRKQNNELKAGQERAEALKADLSASQLALVDYYAQVERKSVALEALLTKHIALETQADESRTAVATLQTRLSGIEIKHDAADGERNRLAKSLAERSARAAALNLELDEVKRAAKLQSVAFAQVDSELANAKHRLEQAAGLLAASNKTRDEALVEASLRLTTLGEREKTLDRVQTAAKKMEARLTAKAAAAAAREEALAVQAQSLATNIAKMEGALGVARSERLALQHELDALKMAQRGKNAQSPKSPARIDGDRALRAAISDLAEELLALKGIDRFEHQGAPTTFLATNEAPPQGEQRDAALRGVRARKPDTALSDL